MTQPELDTEDEEAPESRLSPVREFTWLAVVSILVLIVVFTFNIRPWRMLNRTITAYSYIASNQLASGFLAYRQAFALNTPLDRDARTTLINIVINNPTIFTHLPNDEVADSLNYVIDLTEQNIAYNPIR